MESEVINKEFLSYNGPFSIKVVSVIAKFVTDNMNSQKIPLMRFYRVFIELSQNVSLYSTNRLFHDDGTSIGIGSLFIYENGDSIICKTKNQILTEHQEILKNNCININNSTEVELRKQKEKLRRECSLKDTGAHIGLITIALYSGSHLDFEFEFHEESKNYNFSISAAISKSLLNGNH